MEKTKNRKSTAERAPGYKEAMKAWKLAKEIIAKDAKKANKSKKQKKKSTA